MTIRVPGKRVGNAEYGGADWPLRPARRQRRRGLHARMKSRCLIGQQGAGVRRLLGCIVGLTIFDACCCRAALGHAHHPTKCSSASALRAASAASTPCSSCAPGWGHDPPQLMQWSRSLLGCRGIGVPAYQILSIIPFLSRSGCHGSSDVRPTYRSPSTAPFSAVQAKAPQSSPRNLCPNITISLPPGKTSPTHSPQLRPAAIPYPAESPSLRSRTPYRPPSMTRPRRCS